MGKAWKAAALFGGLAVTTFLAYAQLSPDSQFDTVLLVFSLIFTGFFAISGIIYILLWLKQHFKRESGNRVTYYSGWVYIDEKLVAAGLKVMAKVSDYKSTAETNGAGYFDELKITPPDKGYTGFPIEFYVDGEKASRVDKTFLLLPTIKYSKGGHIGVFNLNVISSQVSGKKDEQKDTLSIGVESCNVLDFFPQPKNTLSFLGKSNILEVRTKFKPTGSVRLKAIELHLGRHTFQTENLPIILLESEDIYPVSFTVPETTIQTALKDKGKSNYLRVLYDDIDCRSKYFSLGLLYEI